MLSKLAQAALNLEEARELRASGSSYRQIGRKLGLTSGQLSHIRRSLSREKAAGTRLRSTMPGATSRDLPVGQVGLPAGLRKTLTSSGYRTLGDLADRLSNPDLPGLEALPGVGPHKATVVKRLLDYHGLFSGRSDLPKEIERLFPEFF
jgi:hypothetical protein